MGSKAGRLAITLQPGEYATIFAPDGSLLVAVAANDERPERVRLVFEAPRDVRISRTKENPWTKR